MHPPATPSTHTTAHSTARRAARPTQHCAPAVLSSPESAALLERALREVGGVRAGGPPKLDPVTSSVQKHKDYGYMHMDEWDFLWSITAKAMLAAEVLRPGGGRRAGCGMWRVQEGQEGQE